MRVIRFPSDNNCFFFMDLTMLAREIEQCLYTVHWYFIILRCGSRCTSRFCAQREKICDLSQNSLLRYFPCQDFCCGVSLCAAVCLFVWAGRWGTVRGGGTYPARCFLDLSEIPSRDMSLLKTTIPMSMFTWRESQRRTSSAFTQKWRNFKPFSDFLYPILSSSFLNFFLAPATREWKRQSFAEGSFNFSRSHSDCKTCDWATFTKRSLRHERPTSQRLEAQLETFCEFANRGTFDDARISN